MNRAILEAILGIVGHITDLLHPGHEHLVVVSLVMRGPQESTHHLELFPDESMVTLDAKLQGHLLRYSGFGVAKRSIQHGLAQAQRRGLHGLAPLSDVLLWMGGDAADFGAGPEASLGLNKRNQAARPSNFHLHIVRAHSSCNNESM